MPTYKSSDPINRPEFVEAGDYFVEVTYAGESISQKGNEMIELMLRVGPSGTIVYDYLVFTENAYWKIDAFRAAIGDQVTPDEEVEIIAEDLVGRTGRVRLAVVEFEGRKRNRVSAWLVPQEQKGAENNEPF